jgi:DNA-directed RNA polymerase specialized sigma24 family protein
MNAVHTQDAGTDLRRSGLMAAAQAGDGAAYQALLRDCIPVIKSVARRRGVAADHVDDVVQDVLLTIHRARQTYDPSRSFTAWLCVIADRRAIDLLRRIRRQDLREVHAPRSKAMPITLPIQYRSLFTPTRPASSPVRSRVCPRANGRRYSMSC